MQRQRKITNMGVKSGKQEENNVSTSAAANNEEGVMADPTPPPALAPVQPVQSLDVDSLVERITAEVLKALEASLDKKIDPVLLKTQTCTSDIASLDTRISGAEQRISVQKDVTESHHAKLSEMELKLEAALEKIDDSENRGRRCNLSIVGLEEGSEGTNPVSFFKSWLPALVGESDNFKGGVVKIDRCHHALSRRPPAGQRPRAVIMKLHNFQDKTSRGGKALQAPSGCNRLSGRADGCEDAITSLFLILYMRSLLLDMAALAVNMTNRVSECGVRFVDDCSKVLGSKKVLSTSTKDSTSTENITAMTKPKQSGQCPICLKVLMDISKHIREVHRIRNQTERSILNGISFGRIYMQQGLCPVPGCGVFRRRLSTHLEGHGELSPGRRESFKQVARRDAALKRLSELRATNPQPPMASVLDLEDSLASECRHPSCIQREFRIREMESSDDEPKVALDPEDPKVALDPEEPVVTQDHTEEPTVALDPDKPAGTYFSDSGYCGRPLVATLGIKFRR
uniref:Uncharacterized protein n=1 Tax=Knipowitschia caucasica TaxID=637954 RepID=A0AAV2LMA7_KNICA